MKLCGVLVQGTTAHNGFFIISHVHGVRKDGDSVATILWELLCWCREPQLRKALLVVDNASGEGKNEAVLCTANMSVWYDWYADIGMRNLVPGHAHSYLDALFSHVQRAMRGRTLCSLADVAESIGGAMRNEKLQPTVCVLERSVDWTGVFTKVHAIKRIHGHSGPLQFQIRAAAVPHAPPLMFTRTTSEHQWEGVEHSAEPVRLMLTLPRALPALKPLRSYSDDEAAELEVTIHTAERKHLLHNEEAVELRRIIRDGTSGVCYVHPLASDGGLGVQGELLRPGTNQTVTVRALAFAPRTMQAPRVEPELESKVAAVAALSPRADVPIFYQPRASVITYSSHRLPALRAEAQAAENARANVASASAAGSGSGGAASPSPGPAPLKRARRSSTPTRRSPRPPQPRQSVSMVPSASYELDEDVMEQDED